MNDTIRTWVMIFTLLVAIAGAQDALSQPPNVRIPNGFSPNPIVGQPSSIPFAGAPSFGGGIAPSPYDPYAGGAAVTPGFSAPGQLNAGVQPFAQPPPIGSFNQQPGALFPQGSPVQWQPGSYQIQGFDGSPQNLQRFVQNIGFEHTWLASDGAGKGFGVHTSEVWASFGLPLFYNTANPVRVTPGFAVHFLDGPETLAPTFADLPSRLYDAYLDAAWEPQINELFGVDLGFRVGVYSDFNRVVDDSLRYQGRGLAILTLTPAVRLAFGVVYLDRNNVKLLPAGGIIWTPNPDTNFRILFPNPKLSHRFTTVGTTEWWWYFSGEYGGGAWTLERIGGTPDRIDYNDIRATFGLEWIGQRGVRGHIEVGYVFDREILYIDTNAPPSFKPDDTIMIRGGFDY